MKSKLRSHTLAAMRHLIFVARALSLQSDKLRFSPLERFVATVAKIAIV